VDGFGVVLNSEGHEHSVVRDGEHLGRPDLRHASERHPDLLRRDADVGQLLTEAKISLRMAGTGFPPAQSSVTV
jgi:hypothetical protein